MGLFGFSTLSMAGPACPAGYSVKAKTCKINGSTVTLFKSNGYGLVKSEEIKFLPGSNYPESRVTFDLNTGKEISRFNKDGVDEIAESRNAELKRQAKEKQEEELAAKKKEKADELAERERKEQEKEDKLTEAALAKERCRQNKNDCSKGYSDQLTGTDQQGRAYKDNVTKTKNHAKAAEITNQGLQVLGSTTVNVIGQAAQLDLQRADAKLSDSFKAAKKATNAAITGSAANFAANTAFAILQAKRKSVHKNLGKELADIKFQPGETSTGDGSLRSQILEMAGNNVAKAKSIQREMLAEQTSAAATASQGAFASTILAVQQAGNVAAGKVAANQQQISINEAKKGEGLTEQIANQPAQMITMQGGNGTPDQNAVTANGDQAATTSDDSDITEDAPTVGLGGPSNPFAEENLGNTPTPGAFQASKPGGSNMGGGGGVSAGGGSAPPTGDQGEQKAQYVANFEGRDRYESGGTMVKGGGGAKGASAGGGDTGLDFNSLLAQFLPKTEGEGDAAQNGILEYGSGGRGPASAVEAPSYLDKSADIFQRIHQTYQEKQGRGHVGI